MMHAERLLIVADDLENRVAKLPPEQFHMKAWKCDSVCCAIGHACDIPEFKALGFCLNCHSPYFYDGNKVWTHWNAVEVFFDLSKRDDQRITPLMVAARIRDRLNIPFVYSVTSLI